MLSLLRWTWIVLLLVSYISCASLVHFVGSKLLLCFLFYFTTCSSFLLKLLSTLGFTLFAPHRSLHLHHLVWADDLRGWHAMSLRACWLFTPIVVNFFSVLRPSILKCVCVCVCTNVLLSAANLDLFLKTCSLSRISCALQTISLPSHDCSTDPPAIKHRYPSHEAHLFKINQLPFRSTCSI